MAQIIFAITVFDSNIFEYDQTGIDHCLLEVAPGTVWMQVSNVLFPLVVMAICNAISYRVYFAVASVTA